VAMLDRSKKLMYDENIYNSLLVLVYLIYWLAAKAIGGCLM